MSIKVRATDFFRKTFLFPCLVLLIFLPEKTVAQTDRPSTLPVSFSEGETPAEQLSILKKMVDSTASSDLELARRYSVQALAIANKSGEQAHLAAANLMAGKTWQALTSNDSAAMFLRTAQSAFEALNDSDHLGEAAYLLGTIAANKREYAAAQKHFYAAIETWEKTGNQLGLAKALNGVSDNYSMQGDYGTAIDYGERAIAILEKMDEPLTLSDVHDNMAYHFLFQGDIDGALAQVNRAMELAKAGGAKTIDLARLHNTRGNIRKHADDYEGAILDYERSMALAKEAGSERGIMVGEANIGHALKLKGDYAAALPYTLNAIKKMENSGELRNLWENYMHASHIYEALGDFEKANEYTWKTLEEMERQKDESYAQLEGELAQKYEAGKRGATIALQQELIEQQRTRQWLIGGIAGLLALAGFSLFWGFRQKQKSNAALELANVELEKKNAENELLLKEIHHRVKNNLQTISSLLNLQSASITDARALAAVQESQNRVRCMALIHQKLYQGEKLAAVEMKDYFSTMGEAMLESFGRQAEQIHLEVQMAELELDVDTAIPLGLITNELLTNSLKYAFPDGRQGKIKISLAAEDNDQLCLKIADDGVGLLAPEQQDKQFGPGTGFGGNLVNLLTMQLGGKLEQHSVEGTATIIRFTPRAKAA